MARSNRNTKLADLPAQSDPSTELDSATFLRAAQPVLKQLESDLTARAKASPTVTAALKARHDSEKASKRTADSFAQWQQNFIDQVAAAWLLSCVFVRTLEDRGLLGHPRIAGPGASDSQKLFFQMAPSLTERDYLLTVFRELTHFEAARDLFDAKHNPVWLLAPSAEAAKALLALFRTPSSDTPAFRFGQPDTRFLGDLYQDLNERVRDRYALWQTPHFVESFILDRTLERAIDRFGLDDTTVIDPTCGSGHFLLGSFDRFYEHRRRTEPGLDARQAAHKSLDAVFGADINPYAVGIARFRLTLAFLERSGFEKLADAPQLPLHLVVADSLLHNPKTKTMPLELQKGVQPGTLGKHPFTLDDPQGAREVLYREHSAVVGNPPYITAKDAALRIVYREQYVSAAGKFSLAAPFTERFFHLARAGGCVGMITADSFMKREFGKKLIENYLPTVNLDIIINTSGAYIPGHGTPTVLLFGTAEEPQGKDVLAVLASRGEPATPEDPEQGHVWRSIADHWSEDGFENDYVTVSRIGRGSLAKHPWSLSGGGATELKLLLEERSQQTLSDLVTSIGFMAITGEDDVFARPRSAWARSGAESEWIYDFGLGKAVRDWAICPTIAVAFPYRDAQLQSPEHYPRLDRLLWPYKRLLLNRPDFGGQKYIDVGRSWFEFHQVPLDRLKVPLSIAVAGIATHNHFVLDRGGKVFNRSAPIIKLPEDASEDDHLAILAFLNSSTACFWMKQVFYPKATATGDVSIEKGKPENNRYEFAGTGLKEIPLPPWNDVQRQRLTRVAREASALASRREELSPAFVVQQTAKSGSSDFDSVGQTENERAQLADRLVAIQEDIDWAVYECFGLVKESGSNDSSALTGNQRPFLLLSATDTREGPAEWSARLEALRNSKELRLIEDPVYKRLWTGRRGVFGHANRGFREHVADAARDWIQSQAEQELQSSTTLVTLAELAAKLGQRESVQRVCSLLGATGAREIVLHVLQEGDAVAFLPAFYLKPSGETKREIWLRTWALQRREDAGESVTEIPVPPKYKPADFKDQHVFSLRGKLDVPKERFISYPGCEADEDGEPVYGWAGWNQLERMQALAALYQQRKKGGWRADKEPNSDGEKDDRLIPMLAGLLELLPWVKQWHNEPSEEFDGLRLGDYFERFIKGECRELGITHDDLESWAPPKKSRRRRKARGAA